MNLHEYQTKEILEKYHIPIPSFSIAESIEEVKKIIDQHKMNEAIVKIQVHAGGRGKAGGVKFAKSKQEILNEADRMIGMKLVNNQTGPAGVIARKILLTKPVSIQKEYYLGIIMDRDRGKPTIIASPEGGVEIEEVAKKTPEKILTLPFSSEGKLHAFQLLQLVKFMHWEGDVAKQGKKIAINLAKAFIEKDATLLEINPLVLDDEEKLWAVDAKLSVDDNAIFRQEEIANCYDPTQISKAEAKAKEFDLAYIAMDGEIGCMVNGAGLAMATMDIIQLYGKSPANFLDVGGGASSEKVAVAFRIILSDPKVKGILINIFGGIMNCAVLAEGILEAVKETDIHVPLVVRMEGTNVKEGKKLLKGSKLDIITANDLTDAAQKIVEATR